MATSEVWTVRGVGEDYRRKAKAAAAAYGETVGEWLERIIGMAAPFPAKAERKLPKAVEVLDKNGVDWSMNREAVEAGEAGFLPVGVGHVAELSEEQKKSERYSLGEIEEVAKNPVLLEEKPVNPFAETFPPPKKGRSRAVCQHGVEKGWNCWQCGGLAVIR